MLYAHSRLLCSFAILSLARKPGCASASQAEYFLCSTARFRQDIIEA